MHAPFFVFVYNGVLRCVLLLITCALACIHHSNVLLGLSGCIVHVACVTYPVFWHISGGLHQLREGILDNVFTEQIMIRYLCKYLRFLLKNTFVHAHPCMLFVIHPYAHAHTIHTYSTHTIYYRVEIPLLTAWIRSQMHAHMSIQVYTCIYTHATYIHACNTTQLSNMNMHTISYIRVTHARRTHTHRFHLRVQNNT